MGRSVVGDITLVFQQLTTLPYLINYVGQVRADYALYKNLRTGVLFQNPTTNIAESLTGAPSTAPTPPPTISGGTTLAPSPYPSPPPSFRPSAIPSLSPTSPPTKEPSYVHSTLPSMLPRYFNICILCFSALSSLMSLSHTFYHSFLVLRPLRNHH